MTLRPPEIWIQRALDLAWKGRFRVSPNPMVGACLVRNHKLIAEGFHVCYGKEHAEAAVLKQVGKKARGAVLYVTLEPCSSWGKTPPCVQAICDSGIREVVIGAKDPNPVHHGRGIAALRKAGIQVSSGILESQVQEQNKSFFKFIKTGFPYVTLKMAQSLDGKIATCTRQSRWITGGKSRSFVHELRAESDAVLVGKNTLLLDNPQLRPVGFENKCQEGKPWRIVLDPQLEASSSLRVFSPEAVTLRLVSEKRLYRERSKLKKIKGTLLPISETPDGRLDLKMLLCKLGSLGISKLLVEGGGELAWSFLEKGFVDELVWITAPKILGGRNAVTSVEGEGFSNPNQALNLKVIKSEPLGEDWLVIAKPR